MPYAPPVDPGTFYDEETLEYLYSVMSGRPWAIHLIGPDEIHFNVDFEKDPDADDNPELTQRTALKTASELNAFVAAQPPHPGEDPPLMYHAVVFHHGEPWLPSESDGPAGEYCEWFDFAACEWFCNQCFRALKDDAAHCRTCAPVRFAGLKRLECDAEPTHPALFMYADNLDGYGSPICFYCITAHQEQVRVEQEHAGHRPWRRWKATNRALRVLNRLGVVRFYQWSYTSLCEGCVTVTWRWSK